MSKWVLRLVAILIGVGLVYLVGSRVYELKEEQSSPNAGAKKKGGARVVSVDLAAANRGQVREVLLLTGALKPKEAVDVVAKATGRVEKLFYNVGDRVKKGDLVAELEDDEIQQRVRRAEASLAVSAANVAQRNAELSNVKANLERSKQLFDEGLLVATGIRPAEDEPGHDRSPGAACGDAQRATSRRPSFGSSTFSSSRPRSTHRSQATSRTRYVDEGALLGPSTRHSAHRQLWPPWSARATFPSETSASCASAIRLRCGWTRSPRKSSADESRASHPCWTRQPVALCIEIDIPNPEPYAQGRDVRSHQPGSRHHA